MDFDYSLCESIDYQEESLPQMRQPMMQTPPQPEVAKPTMPAKTGSSYITMTREQLQQMLAATAPAADQVAPEVYVSENATGKFSEINRMD